jgi:TolA-binding protein
MLVRARADYYRALDMALGGDETNALSAFTNFVATYPTNELAPRAQWWIGDYYWRTEDYNNAELNYQYVFRNWPQSKLAYEARMMAARTAMARLSLKDARSYVTNLTSDLNCPPELKSRAMFAYGDTLMRLKSADTNDALANYAEALKVFSSIERNYPSNELAARAQGMIGKCYLQFAVQDVNQYSNAWKAFQQVVDAPWADAASRSEAEVGLATVLEKLALTQTPEVRAVSLQSALDHYLNVFYEKNLRAGEAPDLFWVKKAGMEAGRLAESLQAWPQALKLYQRLQTQIPSLKPMLENKILKAREQLGRANT